MSSHSNKENKYRKSGEIIANTVSSPSTSLHPLHGNSSEFCDEDGIASIMSANPLPMTTVESGSELNETHTGKHKRRTDPEANNENQTKQASIKWRKEMQKHGSSSRKSVTGDPKSIKISSVSSHKKIVSEKSVRTSKNNSNHNTRYNHRTKGNFGNTNDQSSKELSTPQKKATVAPYHSRLYELARGKQILENEKKRQSQVQKKPLSLMSPNKVACSALVDLYERGMRQKAKLGKIRSPVKHQKKASTAPQTPKMTKSREKVKTTNSSIQPVCAKKNKECIAENRTEHLSMGKNSKVAIDKQEELGFDNTRSQKTNDHSVNSQKGTSTKKKFANATQTKETISAIQLFKPDIRISQQAVPSPSHGKKQSAFERLYDQKKTTLTASSLENNTSAHSFPQISDQKISRTNQPPYSPNIRASQRTVPSPTHSNSESAFDRLYKQSFAITAKKTERKLKFDQETQKYLTFRPSLNHNIKVTPKKNNTTIESKSLPKPKNLIDFLYHPKSFVDIKNCDIPSLTLLKDKILPAISSNDSSHVVRPNYGTENMDHIRGKNIMKLNLESDSDSGSVSALLAKGGYIEPNFERIDSPQDHSGSENSCFVIDEIDITCGKKSVSSDISLDSSEQ